MAKICINPSLQGGVWVGKGTAGYLGPGVHMREPADSLSVQAWEAGQDSRPRGAWREQRPPTPGPKGVSGFRNIWNFDGFPKSVQECVNTVCRLQVHVHTHLCARVV